MPTLSASPNWACRVFVVLVTSMFSLLGSGAMVSEAAGCDYYASPDGGGNGLSAAAASKISAFWRVAAPGKTLCLLDGTYRGDASMIIPPPYLHGAAGQPITVRALNDGKVTIDGQGGRRPVFLSYNDYFVLEGFNAANSSDSVVRVVRSKHTVVRRVAGWDAADSNTEIFSTSSSEDTLFEDVAGWGTGRKIFSGASGGNRLTCRRCWGRWEGSHVVGPKMTYELASNNSDMLVENSIGAWSGERMKQTYRLLDYNGRPWNGRGGGKLTNYAVDQPYGIFGHGPTATPAGARILGSIAYVAPTDRFAPSSLYFFTQIDRVQIVNSVGFVTPGTNAEKRAFGLYNAPTSVATPSLVAQSLTGVAGTPPAVSSQWRAADIVNGRTAGEVANVYASGRICTRYRDGVLTAEPLWPWPMNQRIVDAMARSGRAPVDVTRSIQQMLGPIPAACSASTATAGQTTATAPASPLLRVDSLSLGAQQARAGDPLTATLTVANAGSAPTGSVAFTLWFSPGATLSTSSAVRVASLSLGSLAPGASVSYVSAFALPTWPAPGDYAIVAQLTSSIPVTSSTATLTSAPIKIVSTETVGTSELSPVNTATGTDAPSALPASEPDLTSAPINCDHYASPGGGGNGLTAWTPSSVAAFWRVAAPGKTLCLLDGTYRGDASMIAPPPYLHGAQGQPITVRALHDGKVTIDGEGVRRPAFLNYNDYFVLEGFNAARSSETVVRIVRSNHNIVRRVAAWDAADGNTHIFSTSSSEDTLFEDVAGWGIARKIFSGSAGGNRLTCRRCWGRWEGSHVVGPKMTYELTYHSSDMLVENSIGTWSGQRMKQTYTLLDYSGQPWTGSGGGTLTNYEVNQPFGIFSHGPMATPAGARVLGSVAYLTPSDRFAASSLYFFTQIDGVQITNSVSYVPPGTQVEKRGFALYDAPTSVSMPSLVARSLASVAGTPSAISSDWHAADIVDGRTTAEVANAYLSGRICTRYRDGALTDEPLWPWPMNQRIVDAMAQSGRAAVDVTRSIEQMFGPIPARCSK